MGCENLVEKMWRWCERDAKEARTETTTFNAGTSFGTLGNGSRMSLDEMGSHPSRAPQCTYHFSLFFYMRNQIQNNNKTRCKKTKLPPARLRPRPQPLHPQPPPSQPLMLYVVSRPSAQRREGAALRAPSTRAVSQRRFG